MKPIHRLRVPSCLATTCALLWWAGPAASADAGPAFPCQGVRDGSVEALVCSDAELGRLDRSLAQVYAQARAKASNEHPPTLAAEQRGWIKGRDDCWKADDRHACVRESYRLRIAELQARYRLVPATGPITYTCHGRPGDEVVATYFPTDPPSLIAERGDQVSLMFVAPSGSGARYEGRNESLWEHRGEARIRWGYGAEEMVCMKQP